MEVYKVLKCAELAKFARFAIINEILKRTMCLDIIADEHGVDFLLGFFG